MKKILHIAWMSAVLAWSAAGAAAQQRPIQPSPAYTQGGTVYYPAAPRPAAPAAPPGYPASAQPVYLQPAPAYPAPVYAAPAEEAEYEEEYAETDDEEGIYWFWGAKWPGLAVAPKIGTLGLGADVVFGISQSFSLRSGASYGPLSFSASLGDVKYDIETEILAVPLLLDIHPGGGHFRLTAGAYLQPSSSADLTSTPGRNTQIGSHTYPPEVIGTLTGKIEVNETLTPYLGIGFGNAVAEDQLLTFMLDLGVVFQSYDFELTSNGAGMTTKLDTFRVDLQKEEDSVQSDLDGLKVYPVISLGLALHF